MSEKKGRKKYELNENENDILDLPSLEIVSFEDSSFCYCHVAVFESMWWLIIFISYLILDLPKLHTISFNGWYALNDDDGACRITNCSNLRQLEIGDDSFRDFKSFEISNLNSIQSIKIGNYCFKYADLSLKGKWKERNVIWMKMKMMF